MRGVTEQPTTLPLFPLPKRTYRLTDAHTGAQRRKKGAGGGGKAPFTSYPLQKKKEEIPRFSHGSVLEPLHLLLNGFDGSSIRSSGGTETGHGLRVNRVPCGVWRCTFKCKSKLPITWLISGCWQGNLQHRFQSATSLGSR